MVVMWGDDLLSLSGNQIFPSTTPRYSGISAKYNIIIATITIIHSIFGSPYSSTMSSGKSRPLGHSPRPDCSLTPA